MTIKYAGGHDIGGGLYHYGARFYQPSTARWTQQDPLEQPGDLRQHNRYGYAAGDPVNYNDPTGQIIPLVVAGGLRIAGGYALRVGARYAARAAASSRVRKAVGYGVDAAGCAYTGYEVASSGLKSTKDKVGAAIGAAGCAKGAKDLAGR